MKKIDGDAPTIGSLPRGMEVGSSLAAQLSPIMQCAQLKAGVTEKEREVFWTGFLSRVLGFVAADTNDETAYSIFASLARVAAVSATGRCRAQIVKRARSPSVDGKTR
ncbi:MAG TPA: hypothetical protein VJS42_00570 [Steroidobacteraceae bacterium]|nr:hypothetical protein [Steroidobacteraceae bacterium]